MEKKRYRVVWVSIERHFKKEYDTLEAAEEQFKRVCKSPRMRLVRLFDITDRLKPHPIRTQFGSNVRLRSTEENANEMK
jgi:hypothetical protein